MNFIDTLHLLFLFYPLFILIAPTSLTIGYQYVFLLQMLTPLHWIFLGDQCILTKASKNKKLKENKDTNSYFSEQYLWWLYDPICFILNYEKTTLSYAKVVNIHLGVNLYIMWYYTFFTIPNIQ